MSSDKLFLYPGFYLGIAGLFYVPSGAFFIIFLLAMIIIVQAKPRRILLYVFGWITANAVVWMLLYIDGNLGEFQNYFLIEVFREKEFYVSIEKMLLWTSLPTLIFAVSLFDALGSREGSLHAKTQQFLLLIFAASFSVVSLGGTFGGIDLVFFIPVFTFFLSNYFMKIKKRIFRVLIPNLMIIGSVLAPGLGLYFEMFDDNLVVPDSTKEVSERTLVIGPLDPIYRSHPIAGPFIDERISIERIKDLDLYDRAPVFLKVFEEISPAVVIDKWDVMPKITHRFPQVDSMNIRVVRTNN